MGGDIEEPNQERRGQGTSDLAHAMSAKQAPPKATMTMNSSEEMSASPLLRAPLIDSCARSTSKMALLQST
jgi:hypothetical protein